MLGMFISYIGGECNEKEKPEKTMRNPLSERKLSVTHPSSVRSMMVNE
jgi:hypothetical protein